jgi:hypothetical protein
MSLMSVPNRNNEPIDHVYEATHKVAPYNNS